METLFFTIAIVVLVGAVAYFCFKKKKKGPVVEKSMESAEPPAELPVEPEPIRRAESVVMPEPIRAPEPVESEESEESEESAEPEESEQDF